MAGRVHNATCLYCEGRLARSVPITDGNVVVRFPLCGRCEQNIRDGIYELDKPTTLMLLERLKERGIIDDYLIDLDD